ncbi:MAG: cytochrome c-type biogenesis protein CcmH [Motiliproteus sp.]
MKKRVKGMMRLMLRRARLRVLFLGVLLGSLLPWSAQAAIDAYSFATEQQHQQYQVLTQQLRCPKCQNQNLAGSNSPIAEDMRREIHRMLTEGQTNPQVVDFMVARYGDFVNYRPRRDSSTLLLWYGPIGMLLIGAVVVLLISRRKGEDAKVSAKPTDTAAQERLQRLLNTKDVR